MTPLNRALTSGGSSGGESALIAFGGSMLGMGTDIGESMTRNFPRTVGLSHWTCKNAQYFPEDSNAHREK